jgi:hypothetical protein
MAEACLKSARAHLEMQQPSEAIEALVLAAKSESRAKYSDISRLKTERLAYTGWALMDTGDTSRALESLNQAVAVTPAHPLANYLLGRHYEKQGAISQAAPYFDRLTGLPQYREVCETFRKHFDDIAALVPAEELQAIPEKIEIRPKASPAVRPPAPTATPVSTPAKTVNIPPALGGPIPAEAQRTTPPPQKAPVPAAPKAVAPVPAPAPVAPAAPVGAPTAPVAAPAGK